jgi:hypothetical protein
MAYTGILLRGSDFTTIYNDPPINREAAMAGDHLALGSYSGIITYLNIGQLSKIGKLTDENGTYVPGFKTSDLPINFDGNGYIKNNNTNMLVAGTYQWDHEALAALVTVDDTTFEFASTSIDVDKWTFAIQYEPVIDALNDTDITVSFTRGAKCIVYNQTTKTDLGEVTSSGTTLTFAASQNAGDEIIVYAVDANYNKSLNTKGVV